MIFRNWMWVAAVFSGNLLILKACDTISFGSGISISSQAARLALQAAAQIASVALILGLFPETRNVLRHAYSRQGLRVARWWGVGLIIAILSIGAICVAIRFLETAKLSETNPFWVYLYSYQNGIGGKSREMIFLGYYVPIFLSSCVIAPIYEEFLFVAFGYTRLATIHTKLVSSVIIALFFVVFHVVIRSGPGSAMLYIMFFFWRVVVNSCYDFTNSLLVTIMVHIAWNTAILLLFTVPFI